MWITRRLLMGTLMGVVGGTTTLSAQIPNAPPARLAKATRLECAFSVMTTGTWTSGTAEASVKPAKLSVRFTSVNIEESTADAIGDAWKSHITVRLSQLSAPHANGTVRRAVCDDGL